MLTIQVEGQLEQRLKQVAESTGAEPQAVAKRLLDESLPKPNAASLALLAEWEAQQSVADPVELARRQAEGEAFMGNLAKNRTDAEGSGSRKLWT